MKTRDQLKEQTRGPTQHCCLNYHPVTSAKYLRVILDSYISKLDSLCMAQLVQINRIV